MTSLYIYYKVVADQAPALQAAVHAMQAALRGRMPGLAASLWVRDLSGGLDGVMQTTSATNSANDTARLTWMETYHFNGHADERAWRTLLDALEHQVSTLPPGADGPRHHERFTPLLPNDRHPRSGDSACA